MNVQATEKKRVDGFSLAHPNVQLAAVRAFARDVHDLAGLRALGAAVCQPAQPVAE